MRVSHKFFLVIAAIMLLFGSLAIAQTNIASGSIQGQITDQNGAVVPNAKVTITNVATAQSETFTTNASGNFAAGALQPGTYKVRVEAAGFKATETSIPVAVGSATPANLKLNVGAASETVTVEGTSVQVNTEEASVQGALSSEQIAALPVNGRNFLDLAQLEPGVQIQDGTNFDPTKVGYSSVSFGGRFGRTARIEVNGVDISDETVGTTTENVPASAIAQFQIAQSNLDISNELTSSGAVNLVTKSGSNGWHGEAFEFFRDSVLGAHLPPPPGLPAQPFQRNQFGGNLGGPIIKDRLFFFLDAERTKQQQQAGVALNAPFQTDSGAFSQPFKDGEAVARLDLNTGHNGKLFYYYSYFQNYVTATFFSSSFSRYANKDWTRNHQIGYDFTTGQFTHSFRASYIKFQNKIADAVIGTSLPFANTGVEIAIGPASWGPNLLAPQSTPQANTQFKYDGTRGLGNHLFRYGLSFNHIQGGGFAGFFKNAPEVIDSNGAAEQAFAAGDPFGPGGAANPLNYPVELVIASNGQGYSTEKKALGFPFGGLGPDNRLGLYLGDTWAVKPNFHLIVAARYVRDSGRTDSDLPVIPELNTALPGQNLGARVNQQNMNIAPQLGFNWDVTGNGKTSVTGGIGIFYDNVIFNNVLFDRPARLQKGAFLQFVATCFGGTPLPVSVPGGTITPPVGACGDASNNFVPIGSAAPLLAAFSQTFQADSPLDPNAPNGNYVGTLLSSGINVPLGLFAPKYKTPRSVQMNFGVEHQFGKGVVLSVDYLRNVSTHFLLGVDQNHVGDSRYFDMTAAQNAISATNASFGCGTVDCAIAAGAKITDYAGNGLTSAADFGGSCGGACAFPGINPAIGTLPMLEPIGRSVYNGLDVKLIQQLHNPLPGFKFVNFQVSYSLSRFVNPGGSNPSTPGASDQDFVVNAADNRNPLRYMGPSLLDRTHQLSFGGYADVPGNFEISVIGHLYSALPNTPVVPTDGNIGDIFINDFTGDGTTGDPLPGATIGSFGRDYGVGGLTNAINNYNATVAGNPTPAGQVLINNGLFTLAQLQALGGVAQPLTPPPHGQVNMGNVRQVDMKLKWTGKIGEHVSISPGVGVYNIFNFSNFDLPPNTMSGALTGSAGSINGTTYADRISNRVGLGTGVFGLGAPRQIEFGLQIAF